MARSSEPAGQWRHRLSPALLRPIYSIISNPAYGGAYAYGKTRAVAGYDGAHVRSASRRRPRTEWLALKPRAHEGYVDWGRAEAIRLMVRDNVPTSRHHGAPKHGDALLAGLLRCRRCGRKPSARGASMTPPISLTAW